MAGKNKNSSQDGRHLWLEHQSAMTVYYNGTCVLKLNSHLRRCEQSAMKGKYDGTAVKTIQWESFIDLTPMELLTSFLLCLVYQHANAIPCHYPITSRVFPLSLSARTHLYETTIKYNTAMDAWEYQTGIDVFTKTNEQRQDYTEIPCRCCQLSHKSLFCSQYGSYLQVA